MSSQESIYKSVTDRIIAELEQGTAPWVKPWQAGVASGMPYNAVSQKPYSGVNVMMLWLEGIKQGYKHPAWLTFKQAKELGGYVKRGEHGVYIVYTATSKRKKKDSETEEEEKQEFRFLKVYKVFNIEQTEGLPDHLYRLIAPKPFNEAIEDVEAFIRIVGADLRHGGGRAFYSPSGDYIRLPHPGEFKSASDYYATNLHEHAHWSGHTSRLARDLSGRFGSECYAAEELIAEMAGAFLCAHLNIPGKLQHAEYLGSWLKILKQDKRAIFTAARKATEAADYLRSLADGGGAPAASTEGLTA